MSNCITCTGANACTACSSGFSVSSGACVCPTGNYVNSQGNCTACPASLTYCTACSDANTCTACSSGFSLSSGACVCPTGTYLSSQGNCAACSSLDPNCIQCQNANSCTRCSNDLSPEGKQCLKKSSSVSLKKKSSSLSIVAPVIGALVGITIFSLLGVLVILSRRRLKRRLEPKVVPVKSVPVPETQAVPETNGMPEANEVPEATVE